MKILSSPSNEGYKELHHVFFTNMHKARNYYKELGLLKKGFVLHHRIMSCDNYEEWKIDELIPMSTEEHTSLHHRHKVVSQATREKNRIAAIKNDNFSKVREEIRQINIQQWADPVVHERRRSKVASKIGRKVRCIETGIVYDSMHNAECVTHIYHISRAAKEPHRVAGGFHWEYV
jgi:hypothetical protein